MNQITEDYVSYETAVLLKEKGFDGECDYYYRCHDKAFIKYFPNPGSKDNRFYCTKTWIKKHANRNHVEYILAPTHQMTLKWLRELHRIETHIVLSELNVDNSRKYMFDIYSSDINRDFDSIQRYGFDSFEEAVEAVCLYVLKNLI